MYLLSLFYLFIVKFYRVFLSVHFGGACRFHPTCSCYAEEVLSSHPPLCAVALILKRLSKCHFFGSFGMDPPPALSHEAGKRSIKPS